MHPDRLTKRIFEWDWLKKNNNWSVDILYLLNKLDMADLFYEQNYCVLKETETKLYELCALQWKESLTSFRKLRTYVKHKVEYKEESYLTCNLSKSRRSLLAQLRLGVLPLAIETGRYTGESIELRVCVVCDSNENELHFICQCSRYNELLKELYDFIDVTIQYIHFYTYPVWLGRLTHLLREAQSHWPPFCFHSQLCKNDTRAAYQKNRMPLNGDEYFKCLRKLGHFQQA